MMLKDNLANSRALMDWQTIESLNDILLDVQDPFTRLQQALTCVVERMGCSQAALLVQSEGEDFPKYRVYCNISVELQSRFEDSFSPLGQLVQSVLHAGSQVTTDPTQALAGAFPLLYKEKIYGALLVFGAQIAEDDLPRWERFARIIARAIRSWNFVPPDTSFTQDIRVLETLLTIQNSRNTLLTFFDSIPASVYIIDQNFFLISINLRRSGRLNKHPSVLVGKKCYQQLYNREAPCPECRVLETLQNGLSTSRNTRERDNQGYFVEWEITTFPIQEADHPPQRVIVFEEDVTEKRNLEANLIQSEKLASVGHLAAGVAHEINNPLAAIIANAQLVKRELPKNSENYGSVELIEMAGLRAAQVVNNLLSLARKEENDEFGLLSLNETIRSALTLVNHEIKSHSIDVQLDLDENIPPMMASENHLQGVWINMIVNGIDSIDRPGGIISISSRYSSNEFRVIIADNGNGIPQENLSRIFEPFFTTKVSGKGTGLGLSVCNRVIREHQGSIQVESQSGSGTRFTIILPDLNRRNK